MLKRKLKGGAFRHLTVHLFLRKQKPVLKLAVLLGTLQIWHRSELWWRFRKRIRCCCQP
ncbi:hypothetical protein AXF42_Ash004853 [Apostasia shenzhenica]|uniref:Uncharacterized protein n=1 Tax=Apostasia shenzhenica TaxID=1088818 RepID=A0A2I0B7R5_9ASPA|nr:hypothetical protein AXF42_Ash004853 [Apostasia shenzhenica]